MEQMVYESGRRLGCAIYRQRPIGVLVISKQTSISQAAGPCPAGAQCFRGPAPRPSPPLLPSPGFAAQQRDTGQGVGVTRRGSTANVGVVPGHRLQSPGATRATIWRRRWWWWWWGEGRRRPPPLVSLPPPSLGQGQRIMLARPMPRQLPMRSQQCRRQMLMDSGTPLQASVHGAAVAEHAKGEAPLDGVCTLDDP
jgi:hypothetical protein